tara:strand:- start:1937 stop:2623 length:687 start_codon:yes stop_codon:yes gene_type:complete
MSNKNYEGWELKFFDNSKNFRLYQQQLINKYLLGHLAEVGPGNGTNLSYYIDKPNKIDLFEPSKKHYDNLKKTFSKNHKIKVFNRSFGGKKKYDTIVYLDVLEHIKKDKEEVNKALGLLKKNGKLIINVPANSHLYSNFDKDVGHYKRYSKKDFEIILKNFSFRKVSYRYYDSIGYLLSLMSKLFITNYKKNFEKKIKFWNNLIFLSKLLDKITLNVFGKSLLVIIEK